MIVMAAAPSGSGEISTSSWRRSSPRRSFSPAWSRESTPARRSRGSARGLRRPAPAPGCGLPRRVRRAYVFSAHGASASRAYLLPLLIQHPAADGAPLRGALGQEPALARPFRSPPAVDDAPSNAAFIAHNRANPHRGRRNRGGAVSSRRRGHHAPRTPTTRSGQPICSSRGSG